MLVVIAGLILTVPVLAQTENWKLVHTKTEAQLAEVVSRARGVVGVSALDLTSGERFGVNDTLLFPQGSAIKIPILMEVYKQAAEGKFKLTDLRSISRKDKVGGSGILQDFGNGTSRLSIQDLCVMMIVLSDNTATNMLIDLVGMASIKRTLSSLGLKETRLQRRMMDTAASGRGEENLSTPIEAVRIMEILYKGELVSRAVCDEMLSMLRVPLKMPKSSSIKSGLPDDVPVAFKTGDIPGVDTEWAIVDLKGRPYVLVIMENFELDGEAEPVMKDISRILYQYFWRSGRSTRHGTYLDPSLWK